MTTQVRLAYGGGGPQGPSAAEYPIVDNINVTTSPGVGNDVTQGFQVGSLWVNSTNGTTWVCTGNATGAATWAFMGSSGSGSAPASSTFAFGSGTGAITADGPISKQVSGTGIQPGATAADNVLAVYSIPASSFDVANRGVRVTAVGSLGSTANNKRIKIIANPATAVVGSTVGAGGTTIADTGTVAAGTAGWSVQGTVVKYGAAASNTQLGMQIFAIAGATLASEVTPSLMTATESGAVLVAVTGNASTTATDIVFNYLLVEAFD